MLKRVNTGLKILPALGILLGIFASLRLSAETLSIAVAANFRAPMYAIAKQYELQTGDTLQITVSSSGKLYAQIRQGAPFDVFFSADSEKPLRLEKERRIVPDSRFIYAQGSLVLWSANFTRGEPDRNAKEDLQTFLATHLATTQNKIAMANPLHAPYGLAAKESLAALGVLDQVKAQLVYGENINQVLTFTAVGGIDTAFLAFSQVQSFPAWQYRHIPQALHAPILQEAVLLKDSQSAQNFLQFFRSPQSTALIESFGYQVVDKSVSH